MIKSVKIRLIPNKTQEALLYKSANISRFVYNWTLNQQIENYKNGMSLDERMEMAERCGLDLRNFIHTYTGLDTHKFEEFL